MCFKSYKDRLYQRFEAILSRIRLIYLPRYFKSINRTEAELKDKKNLLIDSTPEESWEWWKYNQSW